MFCPNLFHGIYNSRGVLTGHLIIFALYNQYY